MMLLYIISIYLTGWLVCAIMSDCGNVGLRTRLKRSKFWFMYIIIFLVAVLWSILYALIKDIMVEDATDIIFEKPFIKHFIL